MGTIDVAITDGIARVSINSPKRFNAMSYDMWTRLHDVVIAAEADQGIRVLLLQGAGDKAFVSGADISEFESLRSSSDGVAAYEHAVVAAQGALMNCSKPVVAAIRGVCMGGGIGLALACDLRYSTRSSRFRMPAARMGLGYNVTGMQRFVNTIGAAHTAELFFTARTFDGVEAERIGLVQRAYADDEFTSAVEEVVRTIAGNAPLTLKAAKLSIEATLNGSREEDVQHAKVAIDACMKSEDYREGRTAFMAKRDPMFKGR